MLYGSAPLVRYSAMTVCCERTERSPDGNGAVFMCGVRQRHAYTNQMERTNANHRAHSEDASRPTCGIPEGPRYTEGVGDIG